MTRDEFASLPLKIALGVLYDVASVRLQHCRKPDVPRPPLYDDRLGKGKGTFVWMSEMALGDLEWWANTKEANAAKGGDHADSNAKGAQKLRTWLVWRDVFPHETWSGKRGNERVTAKPPSRNPETHPWPARGTGHGKSNTSAASEPPPPEENDTF